MNSNEVQALQQELGTVGMIRFLQQFDSGSGDYTAERRRWLSGLTVDKAVELMRKSTASGNPAPESSGETEP